MQTKKVTSNGETRDAFTSMIDIVFLLLIFFLCQPFKMPENILGANLPKEIIDDGGEGLRKPNDIHVRIRSLPSSSESAAIYVDGLRASYNADAAPQESTVSKITDLLRRSSLGNKKIAIAIDPDSSVQIRHVLTVLDACYQAQMPNVKFIK